MPVCSTPDSISRTAYIRRIEDKLGRRKLYWFGPRGADGRALLAIDQFDGCFSIMAPLEAVSVSRDVCLETMTGQRVDHNTYSFEADRSEAVREFRAQLLDTFRLPAAIVPYRPNRFLSNLSFPRAETMMHLGLFHEQQSQFEHKPWVETELRKLGVRTLPWTYFADEDRPRLLDYLDNIGPIVLRASRSDGGARVELIATREELAHHLPKHDDGFLCACKFFADAIPLNLNACIFQDGGITLHGLSRQIIGRPDLTRRRFGYCGNEFGIGRDLPPEAIDEFEAFARRAGAWLHGQGYRGVFGLDALYEEGRIYIVEVNPRFQGSSYAVAIMDREADRPDLYVAQLGVFLGLPAPEATPLRNVVAQQQALTLIIASNRSDGNIVADRLPPRLEGAEIDLVARPEVQIAPEATTARVVLGEGLVAGNGAVERMLVLFRGIPLQGPLFEREITS